MHLNSKTVFFLEFENRKQKIKSSLLAQLVRQKTSYSSRDENR